MKIKKNELIIVFVLVYLFVAICGWNFLIRPQSNKASELSDQLVAKQSEQQVSDQKVSAIPTIKDEINKTIEAISSTSDRFFPKTENPELHIENIFGMERNVGVKLINLEINAIADEDMSDDYIQQSNAAATGTEVQTTTAAATEATTEAANGDATAAQADNTATNAAAGEDSDLTNAVLKKLSVTKATVTVRGSMAEVINFVGEVQNLKKVIQVEAVSVEQSDDDSSNVYDATYTLSYVSAINNKK